MSLENRSVASQAEAPATGKTARHTIDDFGAQWTRFRDNDGYYASTEMLADILKPLVDVCSLAGRRVGDVGSGTGRLVNMLLDAGAGNVVALEPSAAFDVLVANTKARAARITYINAAGGELPLDPPLDFVFSIGVIHHIPDPAPVLRRMHDALAPAGTCLVWVYGHEGNEMYLRFAKPLRRLTARLPDMLLAALSHVLAVCLRLYVGACRFVPLPMHDYMRGVLANYDYRHLHVTVFDQLNPTYARYYRRDEIEAELRQAGFANVRTHWRHGYSWTASGQRAAAPVGGA